MIAGLGAPRSAAKSGRAGKSANRAVGHEHSYSTPRLMMSLRLVNLGQLL